MNPSHRFAVLLAVTAVALTLPAAAFGQATRTWVSGVGDDANPCSRTAPCKTFPGAISKTAAGGEINVIDAGGFGGVTITKSITIRGRGPTAGVLVSGTNAIIINAAATDKIKISGLDINGVGTGAPTALVGIKILSAGRVSITNNEIYRFKAGIFAQTSSANTRVFVTGNDINDNDIGVMGAPASATGDNLAMTLRNNDIYDNVCGAVVGAIGANASTPVATTDCGTGTALNESVTMRLFHNTITDNTSGLFLRGGQAVADIGANTITGNSDAGIRRLGSGPQVNSYGNNHIGGNGPNSQTPTSTIDPS